MKFEIGDKVIVRCEEDCSAHQQAGDERKIKSIGEIEEGKLSYQTDDGFYHKKGCLAKIEGESTTTEQGELTPGEQAVGITFNPSGDEKVNRLKKIFAEAFDIVEGSVPADDGTLPTARFRKMRDDALHEIITAGMWSVKVVTYKK